MPTLDVVRRIVGRGSEGVFVAVGASLLGVLVGPSVTALDFFCTIWGGGGLISTRRVDFVTQLDW